MLRDPEALVQRSERPGTAQILTKKIEDGMMKMTILLHPRRSYAEEHHAVSILVLVLLEITNLIMGMITSMSLR